MASEVGEGSGSYSGKKRNFRGEELRPSEKLIYDVGEGSGSDSSKKLIYDVFLSFRGEELRKKFINHLHRALMDKGITVFHDSILPRGKEIEQELYKAIESSKVSIVTFSPDYATSRWCLDELAKMMECKVSNGHIVLPVFYDVEPNTVKHQCGAYKDAFDQHETRFEGEPEKVNKWKAYLREVSQISGFSLENDTNGYERPLIDRIIDEVLSHVTVPSFEEVQKSWDDFDRALKCLKNKKKDLQKKVKEEEEMGNTRLDEVAGWFDEVVNIDDEVNNLKHKRFNTPIEASNVSKALAELARRVDKLQRPKFKEVTTYRRRYATEISLPTTFGTSPVVNEVYDYLQEKNIGIIGIQGLGGIGKTTILKMLNNKLCHEGNIFVDRVLYIDVSKTYSIPGIMNSIADLIHINDDKWRQTTSMHMKQSRIYDVLKEKRFVLLLDNLWAQIDINEIGIPVPSQENKHQIVLTSRSKHICYSMGAKKIVQVPCLSQKDRWDLFCEKVGGNLLNENPQIRNLAQEVCDKCGGLPLVLVVMGRMMSSKRTLAEWRVMLKKLKNMPKIEQVEKEVLLILKYSYDELEDKTKICFLHLCVNPKNVVEDMTKLWHALNLLGDKDTHMDNATCVFNALQNVGFIEVGINNVYCLHDVVVELGLWICEKGQSIARYMPQIDCSGNQQADNKIEAETLFITHSKVTELTEPINCPNLTTLIMIRNNDLESVGNDFFKRMPMLRVIYFACCKLKNLPDEMWRLKNLCYLNICNTKIENLPLKFGELKQLQHLELGLDMYEIPEGVLSNFKELRILRTFGGEQPTWLLTELKSLSNLEDVHLNLNSDTESYKLFTSSERLLKCTTELYLSVWKDQSQDLRLPLMENMQTLSLSGEEDSSYIKRISMAGKLVKTTEIHIESCEVLHDISYLLLYTPNLKSLKVFDCPNMNALVTNDHIDGNSQLFGMLQDLDLIWLPALEYICPTHLQYPHLVQLYFFDCPELKKLPFNKTNARTCEKFGCERSWFDQLEWECSDTEHYFVSKLVEISPPYFR